MDNSVIPLTENNEQPLDHVNLKTKDVTTDLDHSPGRSSVNSFKTITKASSKSIPKLPEAKAETSQLSLDRSKNFNQTSLAQLRKTTSPALPETPTSLNPPSKIPARIKLPSSISNTNNKTFPQKSKPPELAKTALSAAKKSQEMKQRSNSQSNSSRSKSVPHQTEKIPDSISKSSFVTSSLPLKPEKRLLKSQSARSNSESVTGVGKRSASNMSTRSIPFPRRKEANETNLRKMISTAGDHTEIERLDSITKPDQNQLLQKTEKPKEIISIENVNSNDFKNKLKKQLDQWFSSLKDEELNNTKETAAVEKMEQRQILLEHDILALIDDWCETIVVDYDKQMVELKKELEAKNKCLKDSEQKHNDLSKQLEEERLKLERDFKDKAKTDHEEKKELQKKLKSLDNSMKSALQNMEKEKEHLLAEKNHLQEELNTCKSCMANRNIKLNACEQQLNHLKKDLKLKEDTIKKFESDLEVKQELEANFKEVTNKLEELQNKVKNNSHNECVEHLKQISELTNKVKCLVTDKELMIQQNEKLQQDLTDVVIMREKLLETETKLQVLQNELEKKADNTEIVPDYSKEFAKYRQAEAEKRREIDKLKAELSKAHCNMCQLEQQIQRDQQLLDVRSELINALQSNEKTYRIRMEELFAQVGEKNTTINELNCELQTKSEEFRNLFTNLSAKQIEVANQEHIIKLLEEGNERSQMLRVKQEEKIGRMEDELVHLKQTIAIYQTNILTGNTGKHLLFPGLPASHMDCNENFYYYLSQRKRKRQVDINVKKYEA